MNISGEVRATETEKVIFGKPAGEALRAELERLDKHRAFLMVSGTLNRETSLVSDVIATLKSQNRDIRSVSLEEAKELTFQILVRRELQKRQSTSNALQH